MDFKLKDAIEKEDWYSAHQIYLALAQKHQRGKRQAELTQVLVEGTITLARARQVNSANQLAEKLIECIVPGEDERLADVFLALWQMEASSAIAFGNGAAENVPSCAAVLCRAAMTAGCEEAGRYALLAKDSGLMKALGDVWPEDAWCRLVVRCLISKNFMAVSILISSKLSNSESRKTIDDPSGTLPAFTAMTEAPMLNFCELLFMVCQRKCDKGVFLDLLREYAGVASAVPDSWMRILEKTYWPPTASAAPVNPFAQMMQNLMRSSASNSPTSNSRDRIGDLD